MVTCKGGGRGEMQGDDRGIIPPPPQHLTPMQEGEMQGDNRGIIPRTVEDIFTYIVNDPDPTRYECKCVFCPDPSIQIY